MTMEILSITGTYTTKAQGVLGEEEAERLQKPEDQDAYILVVLFRDSRDATVMKS